MAVGFIWSHCHRCGFRNKLGRGVIKRAPVAQSTRDRRVATTERGDPLLSLFMRPEMRDLTFVFEINEHRRAHTLLRLRNGSPDEIAPVNVSCGWTFRVRLEAGNIG